MSKVTLSTLANITGNETGAITTINNNMSTIISAFDNTLSRDGTSPNSMGADFDMNSHKILNLPQPTAATDVVRLQDLNGLITTLQAVRITVSTSQPSGGATNDIWFVI